MQGIEAQPQVQSNEAQPEVNSMGALGNSDIIMYQAPFPPSFSWMVVRKPDFGLMFPPNNLTPGGPPHPVGEDLVRNRTDD